MDIIKEKELLKKSNLFVNVENIKVNSTYVQINYQLDEFLNYCNNMGAKHIYYFYKYYDKKDYFITEQNIKDNTYSKKEYDYCKKWAKEYNIQIEKENFSNPYKLIVFVVCDSILFIYKEENYWLNIDLGINALMNFQEEHEDDIINLSNYSNDDNLYEELKTILLQDANFRYCTNRVQRHEYIKRFFNKKENMKYLVFTKGSKKEYEKIFALNQIVDRIYNEYRNKCYELKIRVGEELPKGK